MKDRVYALYWTDLMFLCLYILFIHTCLLFLTSSLHQRSRKAVQVYLTVEVSFSAERLVTVM